MTTERTNEDASFPADLYTTAGREVQEMVDIIPREGIPVEERAELNAIIREKLPVVSDIAVVQLMLNGHDLSRREFLSRLIEHRIQQPEALFMLMRDISYHDVTRSKLFRQANQEAVRCVPLVSARRVVDRIEKFESSPMGRDDKEVFADMLSVHPQTDEIIRQFLERKQELIGMLVG